MAENLVVSMVSRKADLMADATALLMVDLMAGAKV